MRLKLIMAAAALAALATTVPALGIGDQESTPITADVQSTFTLTAPATLSLGSVTPPATATTPNFIVNVTTNVVGYTLTAVRESDVAPVGLAIAQQAGGGQPAGASSTLPADPAFSTLSASVPQQIGSRPSTFTSATGDDWGLVIRGTFPWAQGGLGQTVGTVTFIGSAP